MNKRIGIIGGGAAGLFAACQLKRLSNSPIDVTVLEKNSEPGKKLTLTGHGRCNITNRKDISKLKEGYHEAEKFLYPALKEFGPDDTVQDLPRMRQCRKGKGCAGFLYFGQYENNL